MTTSDPRQTGKPVQSESNRVDERPASETKRDLRATEILTARADVDADGHVRFGFQFSKEVY